MHMSNAPTADLRQDTMLHGTHRQIVLRSPFQLEGGPNPEARSSARGRKAACSGEELEDNPVLARLF